MEPTSSHDDINDPGAPKKSWLHRSMRLFVLPGEVVCNWLKVHDHDSRMLLRMFVNLAVYGKIAVFVLLMYMGVG